MHCMFTLHGTYAQVLQTLENVRRISEVKAKGGYVAPVKVKESILMPTKVCSHPTTTVPHITQQ